MQVRIRVIENIGQNQVKTLKTNRLIDLHLPHSHFPGGCGVLWRRHLLLTRLWRARGANGSRHRTSRVGQEIVRDEAARGEHYDQSHRIDLRECST